MLKPDFLVANTIKEKATAFFMNSDQRENGVPVTLRTPEINDCITFSHHMKYYQTLLCAHFYKLFQKNIFVFSSPSSKVV